MNGASLSSVKELIVLKNLSLFSLLEKDLQYDMVKFR